MPEISIIIPVYNTKDYVERCVRSVTGQSFGDWELILVDDGSTDGSGEICERLSEEDGRIRVIHQENGGPSKARNAALDIAAGELLLFCDSDDRRSAVCCGSTKKKKKKKKN